MENNDALTLDEKRQRWINALLRKLEMRTLEEWDFETMSETIYKDNVLEFYRECQATYGLENVHGQGGVESDLEYFLDEKLDIGEILNIDALRGKSLLDYMATKDFPMTFQTWPEEISQLRVYDTAHRAMIDIDINPKKPHRNKDGTVIPAGVTHVHEWTVNPDGTLVRGRKARLLTEGEIKRFGKKLEAANKDVRYK